MRISAHSFFESSYTHIVEFVFILLFSLKNFPNKCGLYLPSIFTFFMYTPIAFIKVEANLSSSYEHKILLQQLGSILFDFLE